jgi:RecA/RadA recombinase
MPTVLDCLEAIGQRGAVAAHIPKLNVTQTRLPSFNDEVLKTGGVVGGRVYELYAPASAGKSTLKQILYGDYQKQGKIAADFDTEATGQTETTISNTQTWMENLGVDTNSLITPNFSSAEQCFEIIKQLIIAGVNIIGVDTVAVLQPESMIFRDNESANMRERLDLAGVLTRGFNGIVGGFSVKYLDSPEKLPTNFKKEKYYQPVAKERLELLREAGITITDIYTHKLWYYDCALIGVNHAKTMIGVLYGDPTYTPGGASLGFHSSVRIGMTKPIKSTEKVKVGDYVVPAYRVTRIAAAKNKLAAPFGEMSLRIYQNGQVQEDVPFWQIARDKGLVDITGKNVRILVGEYKDTILKKADFENWIAETPEFLNQVSSDVEVEETVGNISAKPVLDLSSISLPSLQLNLPPTK